MKFIRTWLKSWIFRLILLMVCLILAFIDIHFDLTGFGVLSLISIIIAFISIIALLVIWSSKNGIKRLLTMVICSGALGIIIALLYNMFYWDMEFILSCVRIIFFISGTILLLRLVRKK